jgi:hypothetical protein
VKPFKVGGSITSGLPLTTLKNSATHLTFVNVNLNLFDEQKCEYLAKTLDENNSSISVCNLTNIMHYDKYNLRFSTVPKLLQASPHCFILYNAGEFDINITNKIEDYFAGKDLNDSITSINLKQNK